MALKIIKPSVRDTYIYCRDSSFFMAMPYQKKELYVGRNDYLFRSLIQFDISVLPIQANILAACLNLFVYRNDFYCISCTVAVHQVLSRWSERSVCWAEQPLFLANPESTAVVSDQLGTYVSWDITRLAQGWHSGSTANLGLLLKMLDESVRKLISFRSRDNKNSRVWPYLSVEYLLPACFCGVETVDHSYDRLTTANSFCFTCVAEVLSLNYSYLIINCGENEAEVRLQVSPNGINWNDDSLIISVPAGKTEFLMANNLSRYARVGYRSQTTDRHTMLTIYLQGRTM